MFHWPKCWEIVHLDNSECTASSDKEDSEQLKPSWTSMWPHSRILSCCTWVSELDFLNICFGKSTEQSLSSVGKKSYSVSFTYKHIYQNQWEQFPRGISTKETCYKGCTFANDWKRTKIHPSSVCYLCPHPQYGHSQSGLIFHPFDIVQPTSLGLHRGFCLPNTWLPSSAVSWKNLSPP